MHLNRKKIIFAVLIGFILFLVGGYFLILSNQEQEDAIDTTRNLFPFGEIAPGGDSFDTDRQTTIGEDTPSTQTTEETITEDGNEPSPRLRKISNFPTGGFVPLISTTEDQMFDIEIDLQGNSVQSSRIVETKNYAVRYSSISDATIYETILTPETLSQELIVDNFIPNAERAYFNHTGEHVLFQYWNNEQRTPESYLATIQKIELEIPSCAVDFSPIEIGMDESRVVGIHRFLNANPRTRVAQTGLNSPGNESSFVTEATITAIKNFQSLYQLEIDGALGPNTREKMIEICDIKAEENARAAYENLETKHTISGSFLNQGIIEATMAPNDNRLFYLQKDSDGVVGVVQDLNDNNKETIFESPFSQWLTLWNNEESIELTTKPSYQVEGFSYQLNPLNQRYFKSLPEKTGLTTLASPDNRQLLIMETLDDSVRLSIHNRSSNRTRPLTIQTMIEKCIWAPDSQNIYCMIPNSMAYGNEYPDVWYQGLESYTDSLWKINTRSFQEEIISDFVSEYGSELDIEKIDIDSEERYLYFIDKKTEELWSYRLN